MPTIIKSSTSPSIISDDNDYDAPQSVNTDYNMVSDAPTNLFWLKEPAQDNTKIPPLLSLPLLLEDQWKFPTFTLSNFRRKIDHNQLHTCENGTRLWFLHLWCYSTYLKFNPETTTLWQKLTYFPRCSRPNISCN